MKGSAAREGLTKALLYFLLCMSSAAASAPLIWMMLSAFKGSEELWRFPPTIFPLAPTISGFATIFKKMPFGRYFFNSILVSSSSTALALFTSSLAGYIFAKMRFRGRNVLFLLVLSSMMIPFQVTMIPNHLIIRWLHWFDTYFALIIPQGISVFGIFLVRQFMLSLPDDYVQAARIDGMGEFRIYLSIILPLSIPAISALAIFSFRGTWDSLLWPLIMTVSDKMRTLPIGIAGLATVHSPLMELLMPAATLAVVPILIVFFIFQRQFVQGIAMTGIKA